MPLPYFLTSRLAKLPMAIVIGGGTWLIWTYPRSTGGAYGWLQSKLGLTDLRLGIATAILIAIYIALMLWAVYSPWRKHSPDGAMGIGCVLFAAVALGIVELILVAAIYFKIHFLILVIAVCIFGTTIPLVIGLIAEAIKALRKRRTQ